MRYHTRAYVVASVLFIIGVAALAPASASAFWEGFPFGSPGHPPSSEWENKLPFDLCERTISAAGISISFEIPSKRCDTEPPPPPPPPPEEPTLDFSADPTSVEMGDSSILEWDSDNADTCTASDGWSGDKTLVGSQQVTPSATTTYTLTCEGEGGEVEKDVTVGVILPPEEPESGTLTVIKVIINDDEGTAEAADFSFKVNDGDETAFEVDGRNDIEVEAGTYTVTEVAAEGYTTSYENCEDIEIVEGGSVTCTIINDDITPAPEGKLLITEVYYDTGQEGESEGANEWVEIYNGTDSVVNLSDYSIADVDSSDALPDAELSADSYAIITASSTTESFWNIPGNAVVVVLGGNVGNGLGNGGDAVMLVQNAGTTTIDELSWDSDTSVFDPSVSGVDPGHSIARDPVTEDSDTNAEWVDRETPTPGE